MTGIFSKHYLIRLLGPFNYESIHQVAPVPRAIADVSSGNEKNPEITKLLTIYLNLLNCFRRDSEAPG